MKLTAKEVVAINKQKPEAFAKADFNKDGVVDLKTEMAYAHAYYAAGFDAKSETTYLHTITKAFLDGRQLITDAKGNALSDAERQKLKAIAADTKTCKNSKPLLRIMVMLHPSFVSMQNIGVS